MRTSLFLLLTLCSVVINQGVESRISRAKLIQALQKLAQIKRAKELALLTKNRTQKQRTNGQITNQYKEDTKLEDRLAMEAEEERKFNNGETYESDDDLTGETKSQPASQFTGSSLSPKEQASQEMQSYNALISSESNRELSQIQEEIAKTSQAGMGQVSVEGENQNVPVDNAAQAAGGGGGGLASQLGSSIAAQLGAQLNGGNLANQLTGSIENSLSNMASNSQNLEAQGQGGLEQAGQTVESLDTGGTQGSEVSQAISSMPEMGGQEGNQYPQGQEATQFQPGMTSISQQTQQSDANALSQVGGGLESGGIESMQGLTAGGGTLETLSSPGGASAVNAGSLEGLSQAGGALPAGLGGAVMEGAKFRDSLEQTLENADSLAADQYSKKSKISKKGRKEGERTKQKRGRKRRRLGKAPVVHQKPLAEVKRKSFVGAREKPGKLKKKKAAITRQPNGRASATRKSKQVHVEGKKRTTHHSNLANKKKSKA